LPALDGDVSTRVGGKPTPRPTKTALILGAELSHKWTVFRHTGYPSPPFCKPATERPTLRPPLNVSNQSASLQDVAVELDQPVADLSAEMVVPGVAVLVLKDAVSPSVILHVASHRT